jgi:hypothetical protein
LINSHKQRKANSMATGTLMVKAIPSKRPETRKEKLDF